MEKCLNSHGCRFDVMLRWARNKVRHRSFENNVDAKIEFRCCMDRLTRDLKLYRIPPNDLVKVILYIRSSLYFYWP